MRAKKGKSAMATWFTSDHHFDHKRIIELCNRPFSSVEDMNEHMIIEWNSVVSDEDIVYHLGDFSKYHQDKFLKELKGIKHLVRGNHDWNLSDEWASVNDLIDIRVDDKMVTLCHYAMKTWNASHYGSLHLFGHSHGKMPGTSQSCDVGVDCWGFRPISLDQAIRRMKNEDVGCRP